LLHDLLKIEQKKRTVIYTNGRATATIITKRKKLKVMVILLAPCWSEYLSRPMQDTLVREQNKTFIAKMVPWFWSLAVKGSTLITIRARTTNKIADSGSQTSVGDSPYRAK